MGNKRKEFYLRNGFISSNKYIIDNGVKYEILITNKKYNITKETLEKILEKNKRIYNKRNHIDGIRCVTIEEEDSEMFEDLVNICINSGYKIISSSCNSSNWKAILVEDEKERS